MSDYGQPDLITEIGAPADVRVPHRIINVPNTFQLTVKMHNEGAHSLMIHGNPGTIEFQARECVSNTTTTLASSAFTVQPLTDFDVDSSIFTTGPAGDLDVGTYELTVLVSMDNPPESSICSAFNQTMVKII
jgi:hypothetical protein